MIEFGPAAQLELWVSLASLLRSYAAAHGLNSKSQPTFEWGENRILLCHEKNWLNLERDGAKVTWRRDDGQSGVLELTEAGQLRSDSGEEEMDLAAEAWARELMR